MDALYTQPRTPCTVLSIRHDMGSRSFFYLSIVFSPRFRLKLQTYSYAAGWDLFKAASDAENLRLASPFRARVRQETERNRSNLLLQYRSCQLLGMCHGPKSGCEYAGLSFGTMTWIHRPIRLSTEYPPQANKQPKYHKLWARRGLAQAS